MSAKVKYNGEWIRQSGKNGRSAQEIACSQGFKGSIQEWLDSLHGVSPTPEDVLATIPQLSGVDLSLWNDGIFVEKLNNGDEYTHEIIFDENGAPIRIDDIEIMWPVVSE